MIELNEEILKKVIKKRPENSHKGTFGRVLVIGGNAQYGGAAILAASAAVYSGAGLVTVATDAFNHAALHARLPEAMVLDFTNLESVLQAISSADVVVIGCGLGLERLDLLEMALTESSANCKLIIDGSAITLFAENQLTLKYPENTVFTPHEMELQRLSGIEISQQNEKNIQEFTNQTQAIIVAKSHETKIFAPNQSPQVLKIGSPAQATGGMGDTLAGVIGGFLAQFHNENLAEIVSAATFLHSKIASELAGQQYVVLPSQIISEIPIFMKKFSEK
jgi:hydroxyethylthiazole kinase-like uncharacterized protein yjeF